MPACSHCAAAIPAGATNCPRCGVTWSGAEEATLPGRGHHTDPLTADAMIGRSIIGQFVVRHKLGDGGMGAVYLADQPEIGRSVVIKVIHPWLSKDPQIAERFAVEARSAARLHSPHIVAIHNYGRLPDGTLFLAMEHLPGSTLADVLRKQGRMDATRAVAIARQVCEALVEAHRRGVVHRDLKPSNIMLLPRGQGPGFVKVLDFGVARIDGRETRKSLVGTPAYMSPEQLTGDPIDGRSDIYSLAVVLYEMLTGRTPFVARNANEMARLHETSAPPPPSAVVPGVWIPHAVEACVMRALARHPHARPQAADLFADELYNALMATVADSVMIPIPTPRRPHPSRRAVVLAVLFGVILLGGGATAWWWTATPDASSPAPAADHGPSEPRSPVSSEDDEERGSEPAPQMSAAKRALLELPSTRLETELQRVAVLRGVPTPRVSDALEAYRGAMTATPRDADPESLRRSALADLILAWQAMPPVSDPSARDQDELEAVFLTMDSALEPTERSRMLNELKNRVGDGAEARRAVREQLVAWIDEHGGRYGAAPEDDETIEIEEG